MNINSKLNSQQGSKKSSLKQSQHSYHSIQQKKTFVGPRLVSKPNQKQEKTQNFFKTTRIDSCTYIKFINGKPVAMPYYERPYSSHADAMARSTEFSSVTREQFSQKVNDTVSSGKKKLEPYNPNSCRNRLPIVDLKIPLKNSSAIQFGDRISANKKLYVSTQKNQYGNFGKMNTFNSNPMIIAEKAKWHHKMQNH